MLFRRLILCAVAIGVVAGVVLGLAEQVTTAPLIEAAEQYEVADHAAADHHHHDHAWAPADGGQRVFFTVVASVGVAIGFALMLLVAMSLARVLHGRPATASSMPSSSISPSRASSAESGCPSVSKTSLSSAAEMVPVPCWSKTSKTSRAAASCASVSCTGVVAMATPAERLSPRDARMHLKSDPGRARGGSKL